MKKLLTMMLFITMSISLIACTNAPEQEKTDTKQEEVNQQKDTQEEQSEAYFKNNIAETEDVKIEITKTKIIPVGESGNEYGDKPVIAFWYKTTNKTDKEVDPTMAWMFTFIAIQDNNADSLNELEVGMLPDERFLDSQLENIKKGGTVENAVAYELDDEVTPVTLVAKEDLLGNEIGRQDYNVK